MQVTDKTDVVQNKTGKIWQVKHMAGKADTQKPGKEGSR